MSAVLGGLVASAMDKKKKENQKKQQLETLDQIQDVEDQLKQLMADCEETNENHNNWLTEYAKHMNLNAPDPLTADQQKELFAELVETKETLLNTQAKLTVFMNYRKRSLNDEWRHKQIDPNYIKNLEYMARSGVNDRRDVEQLRSCLTFVIGRQMLTSFRLRKTCNGLLESYVKLACIIDSAGGLEYSEYIPGVVDDSTQHQRSRQILSQQSEVKNWIREANKIQEESSRVQQADGSYNKNSLIYDVIPIVQCLSDAESVFRVSVERSLSVIENEKLKAADHFQRTLELSEELARAKEELSKFKSDKDDADAELMKKLSEITHENQDYMLRLKISEAQVSKLRLELALTERRLSQARAFKKSINKEYFDQHIQLRLSPGETLTHENTESPRTPVMDKAILPHDIYRYNSSPEEDHQHQQHHQHPNDHQRAPKTARASTQGGRNYHKSDNYHKLPRPFTRLQQKHQPQIRTGGPYMGHPIRGQKHTRRRTVVQTHQLHPIESQGRRGSRIVDQGY